METLIVICLLVVIVLLLQDKIVIKKAVSSEGNIEKNKEKAEDRLPSIMGIPKPVKRLWTPNNATERQDHKKETETNNFDHEIEKKDFDQQIPQEELDEVF